MASACVNNGGVPLDSALFDFATPHAAYGFVSPRNSVSSYLAKGAVENPDSADSADAAASSADPDESAKDLPEFEFRLDDPVTMLPADELFSDGKLVPLQIAAARPHAEPDGGVSSSETERPRRVSKVVGSELCAQSPKAPRCSSRWRELLGLKKQQNAKPEPENVAPLHSKSPNISTRSFRHLLLHRHPKHSASESSLSIPFLHDSDSESVPLSISARRSLSSSSSSSGADHDELPRLSLDAEKTAQASISLFRAPPRVRVARPRGGKAEGHRVARAGRSTVRQGLEGAPAASPPPRGASVDSPRMNASGKVVFQGLERSSSSPGSFQGRRGQHNHHRGKPYPAMERSYSANVRVAPVLNVVLVGSLRAGGSKPGLAFGLGHLFSPHKKERDAASARCNAHSGGDRIKAAKAKA